MANEEVRIENIQTVLDVGLKCLFRDGVNRFQLKTVAQESGLTEVSIRRYFKNKENLLFELIMKMIKDTIRYVERLYLNNSEESATGMEQFQKLLNAVKDLYFMYEDKIAILLEIEVFLSGADHKDDFIEEYKQLIAFQTKEMAAIFEKGKADGSISNVKLDCDICVTLIWRNIWGCISLLATFSRMGVHDSEYCRKALDLYVEGLIYSFK